MAQLRLRVLFAVFFASGFCGLIYESIWSHYLKLVLGHAAYAQAVVLIVFVGGMAIGAWLTGRWSERLRNPILAYAAVEALVAVAAYSFHLIFEDASAWAVQWLLPTMCAAEGLCWANWALAALLILPPSILLGTTFPLMSAGVLRLGVTPGRGLALLYFLNSAGAAFGVLASGFWLIPEFGLPGTLLISGSLNVAVAAAAYLAMRWGAPNPGKPEPPTAASRAGGATRWLLAVAALTGLSSFIYEVAWIRMLSQVLGAATHSFELMLASFIFGLALGGLWVRNRIDRLPQPERMLGWVQIAMGILAVATLPLYLWCFDAMAFTLRGLSRTDESYVMFTWASAAMAMAVMLPATICAGMTLPIITAVLLRRGEGERQIGRVYGINTMGAILGVLLTVYLLMPGFGLKWALATGAVIDVLLGIAILWKFRSGPARARWPVAMAAAAGLALAVAIPVVAPFAPETLASGVFRSGVARVTTDRKVLFHKDGRTASISVLERVDGHTALVTNGKVDGATYPKSKTETSSDDATVTLLGTLGPAHHPTVRHAAVIGLGTGITTHALLMSSNVESVETIEIEPLVLEAAQLFRPLNAAAFDDPRSRIVIDDARAHFARTGRLYDLIVSEPSNPWVSGVSGLFTSEFYERVAAKLAPGGHFVQWLQLYEASPEMIGSIVRAYAFSFPEFRVYATNRGDIILVGRADGKPVELSSGAFDSPRFAAQLQRIGIDSQDKLAAHDLGRGSLIQMLLGSYGAPANSDYYPYLDNRAARDRFMSTTATMWQGIALAPVPLLELSGASPSYLGKIHDAAPNMPRKLHILASAWHGRRYLRGETLNAPQLAYIGPFLKDYELTRVWLWSCKPPQDNTLWDAAVTVATEINPGLPPDEAGALWRGVLRGPCAKALSKPQIDWLEFFAAVGERKPAAMRDASDKVLAQGAALTPVQHEYAVLAAVAARIALSDLDSARKLFEEQGKFIPANRMDLPWFRYIALLLSVRAKPATTPAAPASAPVTPATPSLPPASS